MNFVPAFGAADVGHEEALESDYRNDSAEVGAPGSDDKKKSVEE